jgi:hypothetical protein
LKRVVVRVWCRDLADNWVNSLGCGEIKAQGVASADLLEDPEYARILRRECELPRGREGI